jgi:peptide/nickel transport system permease protein
MLRYIASRLLTVIPTLFVVSVVVFGLQQMLPGDAAIALAGENLDPAIIAQIRAVRHLDQPVVVQYALWLTGVLHGDLGQSLRNNIAVAQLISEKLTATAILSTMAMGWAVLIGVPAGIVSALYKGRGPDYLANVIGLAGLSVPPFWLGLMLILFVSVKLGLLPASGYVSPLIDPGAALRSLLLPSFVLGINIAAVMMRHTRSAMVTSMAADYIRTARQGAVRTPRGAAARLAQRLAAADHHGHVAGWPVPCRRSADRAGVHHPRVRPADRRCRLYPRLRRGAGRRAGERDYLCRAEPTADIAYGAADPRIRH